MLKIEIKLLCYFFSFVLYALTNGMNVNFISNIPYYVNPPEINSFWEEIKSKEDLTNINCSEEETEHFKDIAIDNHPFKYQIEESNFKGWLHNYSTIKNAKINNDIIQGSSELKYIQNFINVLKTTAFESNDSISVEKFKQSVAIFILFNRHDSLSNAINQQLYDIANFISQDDTLYISTGVWHPKWINVVDKKTVYFGEVKKYFKKLLKYDKINQSKLAKEFLFKNEVEILTKNNNAPYRSLREALRLDDRKISVFDKLSQTNKNCVVYECMHSSNIKTLRATKKQNNIVFEMGVYSFYTEIIKNNNKPDLVTTGYTVDENSDLYLIINEDMKYREKFCAIDPRLVHIPEQNFIVKAEKIENINFVMHYSFLENSEDWKCNKVTFSDSNSYESTMILRQIYEKLTQPTIIFNNSNPIKLFDNKLGNKISKSTIEIQNYYLSQHCFNIHKAASIAYTQFGLHNNNSKQAYEDFELTFHDIIVSHHNQALLSKFNNTENIATTNNEKQNFDKKCELSLKNKCYNIQNLLQNVRSILNHYQGISQQETSETLLANEIDDLYSQNNNISFRKICDILKKNNLYETMDGKLVERLLAQAKRRTQTNTVNDSQI